jgi:hypothetical protein
MVCGAQKGACVRLSGFLMYHMPHACAALHAASWCRGDMPSHQAPTRLSTDRVSCGAILHVTVAETSQVTHRAACMS